jgi:hypothetical protein
MPIAYEFAPELVISESCCRNALSILIRWVFTVSAGFDAADGDTLGQCRVTPTGYAHMTYMLSALAGGKLVVALEVIIWLQAIRTDSLTYSLHSGRLQPHRDLQFCGSRRQNSARRVGPGASAITGQRYRNRGHVSGRQDSEQVLEVDRRSGMPANRP